VTAVDATFEEAGAATWVEATPLAHLSLELGHLYFEDFAAGPDRLRHHFAQVRPWADAVRMATRARLDVRRPRVSTCFLIDDYFGPTSTPADVLPGLIEAARANGLEIDYLARESACAAAHGVPLADLVRARIVPEPAPGTTGSRPPFTETGWLSNGQRAGGVDPVEAMSTPSAWRPAVQHDANRHSVFVDVQLWDGPPGRRRWSCAYLAAVWHLLRLGVLRHEGRAVAEPREWTGSWPSDWDQLPAVTRLQPGAAAFTAYGSVSILPSRFFLTEQAVRTILSQVATDDAVTAQIRNRAEREGVALPLEVVDRLRYVFIG
jgi:hypothetical protein